MRFKRPTFSATCTWLTALSPLQGNPRTNVLLMVAKANNLDVELVHTQPREGLSADYRLLNKLGRVPTFEGADGFVLTEVIAIAVYRESTFSSPPSLSQANVRNALLRLKMMSKLFY